MPDRTKAFAVVVHDPDAPLVDGFTHRVAYGIRCEASGLSEGGGDPGPGHEPSRDERCGGPAPPARHGPHHYYFRVYALDEDLGLESGLPERAARRIEDHVTEHARVIGAYER